jgi:hypothetical protein
MMSGTWQAHPALLRAQQAIGLLHVHEPAEAKVAELAGEAVLAGIADHEQHVAGLQVAVQYARPVQVLQPWASRIRSSESACPAIEVCL